MELISVRVHLCGMEVARVMLLAPVWQEGAELHVSKHAAKIDRWAYYQYLVIALVVCAYGDVGMGFLTLPFAAKGNWRVNESRSRYTRQARSRVRVRALAKGAQPAHWRQQGGQKQEAGNEAGSGPDVFIACSLGRRRLEHDTLGAPPWVWRRSVEPCSCRAYIVGCIL